MIRQLTRPLLRPLMRPLVGKGGCERWVYDFDGVNDYAQFAQRLIDPDGYNEIEFWTSDGPELGVGGFGTILSQNINTFNNAEFRLYTYFEGTIANPIVPHLLAFRLRGGPECQLLTAATGLQGNTKYRVTINDATRRFALFDANGNQLREGPYIKGTAPLEPDATTVIAAERNGSINAFARFYRGIMPDIKINGHLYPINNPNSPEQRSIPDNGNPLTLVNTNSERWSKIPC